MSNESNEAEILVAINEILRDLFDDDSIRVDAKTTAADVPGWDSFMHVNVIVSVEARFNLKFSTSEIEAMKNVGDIVRTVKAKRA